MKEDFFDIDPPKWETEEEFEKWKERFVEQAKMINKLILEITHTLEFTVWNLESHFLGTKKYSIQIRQVEKEKGSLKIFIFKNDWTVSNLKSHQEEFSSPIVELLLKWRYIEPKEAETLRITAIREAANLIEFNETLYAAIVIMMQY